MKTFDQSGQTKNRIFSSLQLVVSGDTALLCLGALGFLAALANATQWTFLRGFRFCGICTMLFSVTFLLFSALELSKPERHNKRLIAATVLFLGAALLCLGGMHISIQRVQ